MLDELELKQRYNDYLRILAKPNQKLQCYRLISML
jgi:hypothetical protein